MVTNFEKTSQSGSANNFKINYVPKSSSKTQKCSPKKA
jgi:hypothetical protein